MYVIRSYLLHLKLTRNSSVLGQCIVERGDLDISKKGSKFVGSRKIACEN